MYVTSSQTQNYILINLFFDEKLIEFNQTSHLNKYIILYGGGGVSVIEMGNIDLSPHLENYFLYHIYLYFYT